MEVRRDSALSGAEVICTIVPEEAQAVVEYRGNVHLRFRCNPGFPGDASALFVQEVTVVQSEDA